MFRRQFLWILLSRFSATILQAIAFILLARLVTPQEYGITNAIIGISFIVVAVADLGIGTFVLRAWAAGDDISSVRRGLRINGQTTLIFILLFGGAITLLGMQNTSFLQLAPLAIWAAAEKTADIWLNVAISDSKAKKAAYLLVVRRLLSSGAFLLLVLLGVTPLVGFSMGLAAGSLAGALLTIRIVLPLIPNVGFSSSRSLLRKSFPFLVSNLTGQLRNLDVAIVAGLLSPASAGYYSAAVRLSSPFLTFASSLANVLLPHATRSNASQVAVLAHKTYAGSLIAALLASALAVPLAEPVVVLLFGAEYAPGAPIFRVMIVAIIFMGVSPSLGGLLQAMGKEGLVARNGLVFGLVTLLLVFVGAFSGHAILAAVGLAVSCVAKASSLYVLVLRYSRCSSQT